MRFMSIINRRVLRFGALSFYLLLAALPACVGQDAHSPTTPAEALAPAAIPAVTPTIGASTQTPSLLTPTSTPKMMLYQPPEITYVPASLESNLYLVPVIVRAPLVRGEPAIQSVESGTGVAPTYRATHLFRFDVAEYIRGKGESEINVRHLSNSGYLTQAEAWDAARMSFANRNSFWDDREAVLFLIEQSGTITVDRNGVATPQNSNYRFTDWVWGEFQYTVDTLNRAWLPSVQASGPTGQSVDSAAQFYLIGDQTGAGGATGNGNTSSSISLTSLRSRVASADNEMKEGEQIAGYERCIKARFEVERYYQSEEFALGRQWTPGEKDWEIPSGSPTRTQIRKQEFGTEEALRFGVGYGRFWLSGRDKDLYFAAVGDTDQDYSNGYYRLIETARPLVAKTYRFSSHSQRAEFVPCNYIPSRAYIVHRVTVTAPPGTVHEAFFDPVAIGSAIGADATNGALKPTEFTANGAATAMQGLKWDTTGIVTLTIRPNASLGGLALDFIALDGSVALTLPASSAKTDSTAGTLKWSMLNSPWQAGDKLMLRIRNATSSPTPTATPTPTPAPAPPPSPTPTPTLIPSPTPTPTALPDPPPGGVSGQ